MNLGFIETVLLSSIIKSHILPSYNDFRFTELTLLCMRILTLKLVQTFIYSNTYNRINFNTNIEIL